MLQKVLLAAALSMAVGSSALAAGNVAKEPPGGEYKKVASLVPLPEFIPGLGSLYVQPATLPAGPFLAYDRSGTLVSTIYMIPLADMQEHKTFEDLTAAPQPVKKVDLHYNAGHPGVESPHYHIVLWHVAPQQAKLQ